MKEFQNTFHAILENLVFQLLLIIQKGEFWYLLFISQEKDKKKCSTWYSIKCTKDGWSTIYVVNYHSALIMLTILRALLCIQGILSMLFSYLL